MYMRIAREWDQITENWQSVASLGIAALDSWLTHGDAAFAEPDDHDDAEDGEAEAQLLAEERRAAWERCSVGLAKWLWQRVGDGFGTAVKALVELRERIGEGDPVVEQMLAVVKELDAERYKQESALEEIGEAEVTAAMAVDKNAADVPTAGASATASVD